MIQLTVTENDYNESNLMYVQSAMSEMFTYAGCTARLERNSGRAKLTINCAECYSDIIKTEIADKVAEVVVIKYKYDFFKKNVSTSGLKTIEKEILLASLIAADLDDDKKYSLDKIKGYTNMAVDGVYNFRLKPLKKKWSDVASYIPTGFLNTQLKEFITYLLENKKKRVYVDCGKVYDSHYRRLRRSMLLGGDGVEIVREVLLSGCGEVELFGDIPKDDEFYLKEYYTDKIYFSNRFGGGGKYLN